MLFVDSKKETTTMAATILFTLRISEEQKAKIDRVARSRSMPPYTWARRALMAAVEGRVNVAGIVDDVRPAAGRPPRILADAGASAAA
jgi:predicted transcriptional regulator